MKLKAIICIAIGTLTLASCSKYEENDGITLRSKKARISNTWEVEKASDNGNDVTNDFDQYTLQMLTDGDASLAALYTFGNLSYETDTDGTWDFVNNKENLELDFEDDDADKEFVILKLTKDELWLREKGEDLELQLKAVD